jgi:oligosaccharide amylase
MSKAITLGNGQILVGFDDRAQIRDFYFPHVGLESHVGGLKHRVGVFVDGVLSWLDDQAWEVIVDCDKETAVGKVTAKHQGFGITLNFTDVVYNEKNILIREIVVKNTGEGVKSVKIFLGQQFQIFETLKRNTCYYDPKKEVIIHYKGKRAFLVGARNGKKSFDDYTVGLFNIEGKEGAYVDALDGELSKNSIEHGSVDSIIALSLDIKPNSSKKLYHWITVGKSIKEAHELNEYILEKTPQHLMKTTTDFWRAWVNKQNFNFYKLDDKIVDLFKKSLIIMRSHVDDGGAIIASSDSSILQHGRDTYNYMWPRDGAFSAMTLDKAGDSNVARRFFEFCNDVISEDGYFMHKYLSDESLGSSWHPWVRNGKEELPIQEDETALVLYALWNHYELSKDLEFIESIYNSLIKKSADFLVSFVHEKTGLSHPSYDLWEEKFGISTFTCASKYGALNSAANFAALLGKKDSEVKYRSAAKKLQKAILKHLYNEEAKMFYKLICVDKDDNLNYDSTLDMSSFYGIFKFGVLDPTDARLTASLKTLEDKLLNKDTNVGGMPRHEGDGYFLTYEGAPPNPWFITTLWLAQYYIKIAKTEKDLEVVKRWLAWTERYSLKSGVLSEQLDPHSGRHLSVAPLVWSHSAYVATVIDYLEKLEKLGICVSCNPLKNR